MEIVYESIMLKKIISILFTFLGLLVFVKIFIAESFSVASGSMMPTIQIGDRIIVNKTLLGARIINPYSNKHNRIVRLYGLGKIEPDDVILFNIPFVNDISSGIYMDYGTYYCKRVLGTPGDRIGAADGHCWNDRVLRPIGVVQEQEKLRWMFDSVFIWRQCYDVIPLSRPGWNIKNWGPLIVPAKGLTLPLDDFTRQLYCQVIEYETGEPLDDTITEYTFQQDYYFAVGDNAMDSYDSRYWGFIPEDFIIGIVAGHRNHN